MIEYLDDNLIKEAFNSDEFKEKLLSRRWFGDKSALSDLEFSVSVEYLQVIAERILLLIIKVEKGDYEKLYFVPLIYYYESLSEILEPSENDKDAMKKLVDCTFSKKIAVNVENTDKIITLNLVEAEYCLLFWKKLLFDKKISEKFPSYSIDLTLYTEYLKGGVIQGETQNLIDAALFPDRFEIKLEQLGKGNTTNLIYLLTLRNLGSPDQETTLVLKSYKEYSDKLEPSKLIILMKNEFPNAPKIHGTVKINNKEIVGILENVSNIGNVGGVYWNELNDMVKGVFKDLKDDFSYLKEKAEVSKLIEENCVETLKMSELLGKFIVKLHKALIFDGEKEYGKEKVQSKAFLSNYASNLNVIISEVQSQIKSMSRSAFYNLEKISSILLDTVGLIENLCSKFELDVIAIQSIHQDLHMEQVLYDKTKDKYNFYFIDFEGDPQLSYEEKKQKFPVEKDIASFLRSLSYIKFNTVIGFIEKKMVPKNDFELPEEILYNIFFNKAAETKKSDDVLITLLNLLDTWQKKLIDTFLKNLGRSKTHVPLINYFTIERALNEINYEMLFRPNKIIVPILGLKELIDQY